MGIYAGSISPYDWRSGALEQPEFQHVLGEYARFGARALVSDALLLRQHLGEEHVKQYMYGTLQDLQRRVGMSLVGAIYQAGGVAVVQLNLENRVAPHHHFDERELLLTADVQYADRLRRITRIETETIRVEQPHFEYFPADWVCCYCGFINNGLRHPCKCVHCGGPKLLDWRERTTPTNLL